MGKDAWSGLDLFTLLTEGFTIAAAILKVRPNQTMVCTTRARFKRRTSHVPNSIA